MSAYVLVGGGTSGSGGDVLCSTSVTVLLREPTSADVSAMG
jgi:hypothetical protein